VDAQIVQDTTIHDLIDRDRRGYFPASEVTLIKRYRAYARGRQRGTLTREQMRVLQGLLGNRFSDNVCRRILTVATSRTEFLRWRVEDTGVQDFLDEVYTKNQVADLQHDVTWATLRDGNHAVSIRWLADPAMLEGGRISLHRERWWDGEEGVFIAYDDNGIPSYAVKEWRHWVTPTIRKRRRTVYLPGVIARYIEDDDGWRPYTLEDDALGEDLIGPGLERWEKADGSPLGIPVVHFPNGSDDDQPYGASDLDGGVLAFQDQINNIQHDISAASTMAGYQQTWSSGTTLERDPAGNVVVPQVGPGQHWHADEDGAKFGVIPPGDLSSLERAYMLKIGAVSRMTSTPSHFFTGQWPSGEALIRAEIDLVEKVRKLAKTIGPAWATVGHRATEIYNAFNSFGEELDESPLIRAIFADPARRDVLTLTQIAAQQADFTSKRERLRLTGRTDDEAASILQEIEDERMSDVEAARRAFEMGEPTATGFGD
jgi:hypothetical protein